MIKYPLLIALLVSLTFASTVFAAGYGAAGCGFGGMVIKDNGILPQIGAWFLNGLLGNQTFAMTSGTSECKNAFSTAQNEQNSFVAANFKNLAKEMAIGEGESLNTLAGLMGCPAEQVGSFASFSKESYPSIFTSDETTPTEMLTALKKELSSRPELAAACPKI